VQAYYYSPVIVKQYNQGRNSATHQLKLKTQLLQNGIQRETQSIYKV